MTEVVGKLLRVDHPSVHDINGAIKHAVNKTIQQRRCEIYRTLEGNILRDEMSDEIFVAPQEEFSFRRMSEIIEFY